MGKVHGSLARAGKVRAATPKVDKQPKRRTVCGRAKKRMLYQKRFVLVDENARGPKRGPNCQALRKDINN